jgi:5-methylcytosine-specific restriction endonuclease McrA
MVDFCPICNREMIEGTSIDLHHLIPRTFGGKITVKMHRICHTKIHSLFTERELLNFYNTVGKIVEHEEIQKFIKWVSKKEPEFYDSHRDSKDRKKKRKK